MAPDLECNESDISKDLDMKICASDEILSRSPLKRAAAGILLVNGKQEDELGEAQEKVPQCNGNVKDQDPQCTQIHDEKTTEITAVVIDEKVEEKQVEDVESPKLEVLNGTIHAEPKVSEDPDKVPKDVAEAPKSEKVNGESEMSSENCAKGKEESFTNEKCGLSCPQSADDDVHIPELLNWPLVEVRLEWHKVQNVGAGLANLGNTCFLNTVIQCLTYCPPLANYLLQSDHSSLCKCYDFCMMCELQKHVKEVLQQSGSVIKPVNIYENLKSIADHFQSGQQEDAHEFLRFVIENLRRCSLYAQNNGEDGDSPVKEMTIINHIFGGYNRNQVICLRCKKKSSRYEHFMDFILDIKHNANTLEKAFEQFVKPELLEKDNAYQCPKCNDLVPAEKTSTIHCAPNVATIQLKRFDYNKSHGGKITKHVSYPERLNLRPFMSESKGTPLLYRLNAVLVHVGQNCTSGHYYCYIRNSNGFWYLMDDARVRRVALNSVLNQQAYLLFYIRIPPADSLKDELNLDVSLRNGIYHKIQNYRQNGDLRNHVQSQDMDTTKKGRYLNGQGPYVERDRSYAMERNRRNASQFKRPQNGIYPEEQSPRRNEECTGSPFHPDDRRNLYYRNGSRCGDRGRYSGGIRTSPNRNQSFGHFPSKSGDYASRHVLSSNGDVYRTGQENIMEDHFSQENGRYSGYNRLYQNHNSGGRHQHNGNHATDGGLSIHNGNAFPNGCVSHSPSIKSFYGGCENYSRDDDASYSSKDSDFSSGSDFREPLLPCPEGSSQYNWNRHRSWDGERNEQRFQNEKWPYQGQKSCSYESQRMDKRWNNRTDFQHNWGDSHDVRFGYNDRNRFRKFQYKSRSAEYGSFGQHRYHPYNSWNPRLAESF